MLLWVSKQGRTVVFCGQFNFGMVGAGGGGGCQVIWLIFLATRVLGKNADKKLGRERRHVSGEGEVMSMFRMASIGVRFVGLCTDLDIV